MAKIELSQEVREIESLIALGDRAGATERMQGVQTRLGRRPEWRFLRCLFDASFRTRADREILDDAVALVGDQPDLTDAAALLGELYARTGDRAKAELFAREALAAPSEQARSRATRVLEDLGFREGAPTLAAPLPLIPSLAPARRSSIPVAPASIPPDPSAPRLTVSEPPSSLRGSTEPPRASFPPPAPMPSDRPRSLSGPPLPRQSAGEWIEQARGERVHRRTPLHGVKQVASTVDALLDLSRAVADGRSPLCSRPLPLTREGLADIDAALLEWRKQRLSHGRKTEQPEPMAAAACLLAVVLHEIPETHAIDTLPDDGGCKVALPSGVGIRPILVASAYAMGTGMSLLETFDRLVHAATSARMDPSRRSPTSTLPPRRTSSSTFPATSDPSTLRRSSSSGEFSTVSTAFDPVSGVAAPLSFPVLATPVPAAMRSSSRPPSPVLTVTRAEAEAAPVCRVETLDDEPSVPPIDLPAEAAAFSRSPLGQEIASRSGATTLATSPAGVEALESYCLATRGEQGIARAHAWTPTPDEEHEIVQWGAFLGATLIALYGGRWEADPFAPSDARLFRVVCGGRVAAWPITQVYLRWKNGAGHDLIAYLATIDGLLRR